jgi:hypothetical protein
MSDSRYLESPARTLREACHEAGRDAGGCRYPDCSVANRSEKEAAERR